MNIKVNYLNSARNLILLFTVVAAIEAKASPFCDAYRSLDSKMMCETSPVSQSDYLNNYGAYYCEKFNAYADRLQEHNPKAKFIRQTAVCLQDVLISSYLNGELSCHNLETIAYQSHFDCYQQNGFCQLSPSDQIKVGNVAFKREFSKRPLFTLRQVFNIFKMCNEGT